MADGHERISPTAHVTAYAWHRIGMPWSRPFVTFGGWLGFWSWRVLLEWWGRLLTGGPSLEMMLEYRHRLIEAAAQAHEPDLHVEIAGGLSRRAVTFAVDHGVAALEIDLPHVVERKRTVLDGVSELAGKLEKHRLVARDALGDAFAGEFAELMGDAQRPVVVMEGLLTYFTLEQRTKLLTSVATALRGRDGVVLCDAYTRESRGSSLASKLLKGAIGAVTRGQGPTDSWETWDDARATFTKAGFGTVERVLAMELPEGERPRMGDEKAPSQVVRARV